MGVLHGPQARPGLTISFLPRFPLAPVKIGAAEDTDALEHPLCEGGDSRQKPQQGQGWGEAASLSPASDGMERVWTAAERLGAPRSAGLALRAHGSVNAMRTPA